MMVASLGVKMELVMLGSGVYQGLGVVFGALTELWKMLRIEDNMAGMLGAAADDFLMVNVPVMAVGFSSIVEAMADGPMYDPGGGFAGEIILMAGAGVLATGLLTSAGSPIGALLTDCPRVAEGAAPLTDLLNVIVSVGSELSS
jgi:hypothetical protein